MLNTESLPAVEIIAWWDENDANRTIARMNTIGRMIREGVFKISLSNLRRELDRIAVVQRDYPADYDPDYHSALLACAIKTGQLTT